MKKNLELGCQFKLGNRIIKTVEYVRCEDCFINQSGLFNSCEDLQAFDIIPKCLADERLDHKSVMFESMEDDCLE